MFQLEYGAGRLPLKLQLMLIFLVSAAFMVVFRDVRVPLDGSAYALGVQRLGHGNFEDVFRWSHALHVPALFLGYRLVGSVIQVDVLAFYQMVDILLGAGGLCLLYLLLRRTGGGGVGSVLACLLVLFSWVYWTEAVTADEKMPGFFCGLVYLNLLFRFLEGGLREYQSPTWVQSLILAVVLSLSILLHASAVLLIPVSVFLVIRRKAFRFGIMTAVFSASLVLGVYAMILHKTGGGGWDGVTAYFSSGLSRYSVASTGVSGTAWIRSVVQGSTKLLWAVFSEDGLKAGLFFAGLNMVVWGGALWVMWRHRRDRVLQGFMVLFVTAGVFGISYAPDAPDSYFLLLVPLAVFFAKAWATRTFRYFGLGFLTILIANNGIHFLEYSSFRDDAVDRRYQEAIRDHLSSGDALVVLDADMGLTSGTQAIIPIHAYFNPDLEHIPGSYFFAYPTAEQYLALAREGRLFIEGLCFENHDNRSASDIQETRGFRDLTGVYYLEPVVPFAEYSSLYHRAYKNVFRVTPKPDR